MTKRMHGAVYKKKLKSKPMVTKSNKKYLNSSRFRDSLDRTFGTKQPKSNKGWTNSY